MRYRDVSLIAVGKFIYIADDRFKVRLLSHNFRSFLFLIFSIDFQVLHESNSEEWFLVINSVTYKDEGIYECQVNSDPYKTFKYHLSVVGEYFLESPPMGLSSNVWSIFPPSQLFSLP